MHRQVQGPHPVDDDGHRAPAGRHALELEPELSRDLREGEVADDDPARTDLERRIEHGIGVHDAVGVDEATVGDDAEADDGAEQRRIR